MIQIIADTLSCIKVDKAKQLNISLLPQIIIFGEETYRDDTEIDTETFLSKLRNAAQLPKTAAPSPALYINIFDKILEKDNLPFVICPTSELSGTYRSAMIAAHDFPGKEVRVVDTRALGAGLGVLVKHAINWSNEGDSADEIERKVINQASRENIYFIVNTLEYLHKGGRIGAAKALLGSVLQIKPILQLKNGKIEPVGSQRTKKKAFEFILNLIDKECPRDNSSQISIMHGGAEAEAKEFAQNVSMITGVSEIPFYEIPAAIPVHCGPGTLGITFFVHQV